VREDKNNLPTPKVKVLREDNEKKKICFKFHNHRYISEETGFQKKYVYGFEEAKKKFNKLENSKHQSLLRKYCSRMANVACNKFYFFLHTHTQNCAAIQFPYNSFLSSTYVVLHVCNLNFASSKVNRLQ
jgi:hypothetical protein